MDGIRSTSVLILVHLFALLVEPLFSRLFSCVADGVCRYFPDCFLHPSPFVVQAEWFVLQYSSMKFSGTAFGRVSLVRTPFSRETLVRESFARFLKIVFRAKGRRGSGVALYLRTNLRYKLVARSTPVTVVYYIFVELKVWVSCGVLCLFEDSKKPHTQNF
jgi:hypothetical protein